MRKVFCRLLSLMLTNTELSWLSVATVAIIVHVYVYTCVCAAHFRQAQLSVFNNNWAKVHDFTPVQDEHNFSVLPEDVKLSDLLPAPPADSSAGVQLVLSDPARSVVPLSLGTRRKCSDEV